MEHRMDVRSWRLLAVGIIGLATTGCSSTLETGYAPRKLGASDDVRRGYYAQPFTPEAKAARKFHADFDDSHTRPQF